MILLIDDDKRQMASYVAELRLRGFEVTHETYVDQALRFLEEGLPEVELLILDVIMPSGESFRDQPTEHGLRTGVYIYERIRETQRNLPIIVFSDAHPADISRVIEGDPHCQFFEKRDLYPFELADAVEKTLTLISEDEL